MKHRNTRIQKCGKNTSFSWNLTVHLMTIPTLFFLAGCSVHGSGNKSPAKLGLPNQTIDAVTAEIREENRSDDGMGSAKQQKFQVFMTDLPDETGKRTDAGLVTLSGTNA